MCRMRAAIAVIDAELKSLSDLNPIFMATTDKAASMLDLLALEAQVAELRLRVMAASDDVAQAEGHRSVATWLAHHGNVRRGDAVADLRLAGALDQDRPVLATALREARVNLGQARVIAHALEELPRRVGLDTIAKAEGELVRLAEDHCPKDLAALGRRILEIVDPQRFEDEEAKKLADSEKHAAEKQRLRLRAVGDGLTRISGVIPDAVAARLATYLHAFTNPRLADTAVRGNGNGDDHSETAENVEKTGDATKGFGSPLGHPRRLAEAFGQLLESLDPSRLPIHGGDATNVTITISLEALRSELGTATLDNGTPGDGHDTITAHQARRLACNARLIPAVLGSDSEVLDLGRGMRLYSRAQRRAMLLRDKTCRADGCDVPGAWCEAHHLVPWSHGGKTDLADGALLCSRHHQRAHDPAYDMTCHTNGDIRFTRRR